jgi:hypothetical protein
LSGVHWLLQYVPVVVGNRLKPGVFEGVFDHFPS